MKVYDISGSEVSSYLSQFQSIGEVSKDTPKELRELAERVANKVNIPAENMYVQIIDSPSGGRIAPHYDTSFPNYINYKCNIPILSEPYTLFVGDEKIEAEEGDLYSFEASLYKHWTEPLKERRILLSFGYGVPYSVLGRSKNDPRVRMSEKIFKHFQIA